MLIIVVDEVLTFETIHYRQQCVANLYNIILTLLQRRYCDVSTYMNNWQSCRPARKPSQSRSLEAAASRTRSIHSVKNYIYLKS